ncbi:hypothetical protein BDA96_06G083100 [Sorghum bicolor]|uniref:Uncharacterized protein n=1 Tax=Sorghum bicolor TaxID=4558 RepID=A0A921UCG6_SORBI|nr:hypothetical protein BDA96_06G083100 [Sorghum bicolor]
MFGCLNLPSSQAMVSQNRSVSQAPKERGGDSFFGSQACTRSLRYSRHLLATEQVAALALGGDDATGTDDLSLCSLPRNTPLAPMEHTAGAVGSEAGLLRLSSLPGSGSVLSLGFAAIRTPDMPLCSDSLVSNGGVKHHQKVLRNNIQASPSR